MNRSIELAKKFPAPPHVPARKRDRTGNRLLRARLGNEIETGGNRLLAGL
jgi:hypothetical protein